MNPERKMVKPELLKEPDKVDETHEDGQKVRENRPDLNSKLESQERLDNEKLKRVREKITNYKSVDVDSETAVQEVNKLPVKEPIKPEGLLQSLQKDRLNVSVEFARHILGQEASDEQVKGLAKNTFREYAKALLFSIMPKSADKLLEMTDIVGKDNLDKALEESGKLIIVSSHMCYFPTGMKMIPGMLPEKTRGTALVEKNPLWPVINLINKAKNAMGVKKKESKLELMVNEAKNPATMLSVVNRLKKGSSDGQKEVLFMMGDRGDLSPDRRRTKVDFFDSQVNFPTGPATISRFVDAPIVPTYITREEDGRLKIHIGEKIELDKDNKDQEKEIQKATQKFADFFERGVKEHPDQWPVYRKDFWPGQKDFKEQF